MKIRFLNPTLVAHTATLTVTAAGYTTSLGTTPLTVTPSSSQLSFPSAGEAEQTWTIAGLPNYVAKGDLGITFTLVGNGAGSSLSGGIATTLYQTESSPLGIQSPVWRNVLDDACVWAIGQSGAEDCRLSLTQGLNDAGFFYYSPTLLPLFTVFSSDDDLGTVQYYRLAHLFFVRSSYPYETNGDCADVANYLTITFLALGVSGAPAKHFPHPFIGFQTHAVKGIGHVGYQSHNFQFHQTGANGTSVYDAACSQALDLYGNPFGEPPVGWNVAAYWQTPRPSPPPGASHFLGLVWRYAGSQDPDGESVGRYSAGVSIIGYIDN